MEQFENNISYLNKQPTKSSIKSEYQILHDIINHRRSVRSFDTSIKKIDDQIIANSFKLALLAPSTSNLQPWRFIRVKSSEKINRLRDLCLNQPAANSASEFIICTGTPKNWDCDRKKMLNLIDEKKLTLPPPFDQYYQKIVPLSYTIGLFGMIGFVKKIIFFFLRLKNPFPSPPCSKQDMRVWTLKNTAFATENLILALSSQGVDSCPLDGFDHLRIKNLLNIDKQTHILCILAIGYRTIDDQKFGPRLRFNYDHFIKEI